MYFSVPWVRSKFTCVKIGNFGFRRKTSKNNSLCFFNLLYIFVKDNEALNSVYKRYVIKEYEPVTTHKDTERIRYNFSCEYKLN